METAGVEFKFVGHARDIGNLVASSRDGIVRFRYQPVKYLRKGLRQRGTPGRTVVPASSAWGHPQAPRVSGETRQVSAGPIVDC